MKPAEVGSVDRTPVPVLITWDVDPALWLTAQRRQQVLWQTMDLCEEFGIRSTFFFVADWAHEYKNHMERMLALGHEIGCHGLTHNRDEAYDRLPVENQRAYIESATRTLEGLAGAPIRTFRSPRVKTSADTLKLLTGCGYVADSSVCSQRLDFLSSNAIHLGWIFAPRQPYHPHLANAFKRGDLPLWEIPVSALVIPFISSSLSVLGLRTMRAFFRVLHQESRVTGKPIVYLAHPIDFLASGHRQLEFFLKSLRPSFVKKRGSQLHRALFRLDGAAWFDATQALFAHMASFPDVEFMTIETYAARLQSQQSGSRET